MNIFLTELFKTINPKNKGFKKKLLSFTFFLILATVFWFLNVLGEKYTENISYPIQYVNLPKNMEVTSRLPESIRLKLSTSGYSLLKFYMDTNKKPLIIDYNSKNIKSIHNSKYLLTKDFQDKIASYILGSEIHTIQPDSIQFQFQEIIKKKVVVKVLAEFRTKEGFVSKSDVYCMPDSIEISGAKNLVKQTKEVRTGIIKLGILSATTKRNVAIKKINGLKYNKYRTNITVPIEQATEKLIELPIRVKNELDNSIIKLIPNTIKLSYKVGLSKYTTISNDQFSVVAVYSDSTLNDKVLRIKLEKYPSSVYGIEFTPNFVEYIKENND